MVLIVVMVFDIWLENMLSINYKKNENEIQIVENQWKNSDYAGSTNRPSKYLPVAVEY